MKLINFTEFIERAIEGKQRELSAEYIGKVMKFLETGSADAIKDLDAIPMQAEQMLQENNFSRESF